MWKKVRRGIRRLNAETPEDGSTQAGQIAPEAVPVRFDYLQESKDLALLGSGMSVSPFLKGKQLIDGSRFRIECIPDIPKRKTACFFTISNNLV